MTSKYSPRFIFWMAMTGVVATAVFLWATFPFWWMVFTSFKPSQEIMHYPPTLLPHQLTISNYLFLLNKTRYLTYFANTIITTIPAAFISIVLASLAAYGLSRFKFFGSSLIPPFSLVCYMLPRILLVISLYGVFRGLHLVDTLASITLLHITFCLPYSMWLLQSYFISIPINLEEAAMIDGASRLQSLIRIVLPLALPGIIATFIFVFIIAWNDYLYALVMISSDTKKTLTLGIMTGLTTRTAVSSWGALMGAGTLMTLPVLILFVFIQRYVVAGFTAGAIKG